MSEVSICNLALSHIGDPAQVTSIKPPDGSPQAQYCANYYFRARNAALEMAEWGFATRRVALAQVTNPTIQTVTLPDGTTTTNCGTWQYAYAMPSGVIKVLAVIPALAPSDYEAWFGPIENGEYPPYPEGYLPVPGVAMYVPRPFALETQTDGTQIILTNECDAILRFITLVEDTTKFTPLFVMALSYLLASMLAGPIIKGDAGIAVAEQMLSLFNTFKQQATASDANQQKLHVEAAVSWIKGR